MPVEKTAPDEQNNLFGVLLAVCVRRGEFQ
jgi:hypothetical protein